VAYVTTRVISGDPTVPGSNFRVRVGVEANYSGLIPGSFYLQILYDPNAVQYVSSGGGELGVFFEADGPDQPPYKVRRFLAFGPTRPNQNPTPLCFTANFRVVADPLLPHSILVEKDGENPQAMISNDFRDDVPVTYDTRLTTDLAPAP